VVTKDPHAPSPPATSRQKNACFGENILLFDRLLSPLSRPITCNHNLREENFGRGKIELLLLIGVGLID
jgi:hypothetical protein